MLGAPTESLFFKGYGSYLTFPKHFLKHSQLFKSFAEILYKPSNDN